MDILGMSLVLLVLLISITLLVLVFIGELLIEIRRDHLDWKEKRQEKQGATTCNGR